MFSKPHSIPFERKKQKAIFHHLTIVVQCALHVYVCVILFSSFISTSHDWLLSIYSCRRAFRFVSSGRKRMAVLRLKWLSYHFDQTFFDTSPCNVWSKLPPAYRDKICGHMSKSGDNWEFHNCSSELQLNWDWHQWKKVHAHTKEITLQIGLITANSKESK